MMAWSSGLPCQPALLVLLFALLPLLTHSAPLSEYNTEMSYYPVTDSTGCYYNFQHYDDGDRILTNEPCLNCTCHNRMLMCYLRVCPFTKAIGQDCTVEKRPDQCCPVITCPEVPVHLLPSTTPSTALGHVNEYGCFIDNLFYSDGARVPSNPNRPCELCYCIRNRTACVMQECTLKIEGCRPVYQEGVCCPAKYDCDHPEENLLEGTTTIKSTTGLMFTTTMSPGTSECVFDNEIYADGVLIKKDLPCEHCYCMKGDIVCAVQECSPTPLDKVNCTAILKEDQCCPDTYDCDNIIEEELTTLAYDYTTPQHVQSENEEENAILPTLHPTFTSKPIEVEESTTFTDSEKATIHLEFTTPLQENKHEQEIKDTLLEQEKKNEHITTESAHLITEQEHIEHEHIPHFTTSEQSEEITTHGIGISTEKAVILELSTHQVPLEEHHTEKVEPDQHTTSISTSSESSKEVTQHSQIQEHILEQEESGVHDDESGTEQEPEEHTEESFEIVTTHKPEEHSLVTEHPTATGEVYSTKHPYTEFERTSVGTLTTEEQRTPEIATESHKEVGTTHILVDGHVPKVEYATDGQQETITTLTPLGHKEGEHVTEQPEHVSKQEEIQPATDLTTKKAPELESHITQGQGDTVTEEPIPTKEYPHVTHAEEPSMNDSETVFTEEPLHVTKEESIPIESHVTEHQPDGKHVTKPEEIPIESHVTENEKTTEIAEHPSEEDVTKAEEVPVEIHLTTEKERTTEKAEEHVTKSEEIPVESYVTEHQPEATPIETHVTEKEKTTQVTTDAFEEHVTKPGEIPAESHVTEQKLEEEKTIEEHLTKAEESAAEGHVTEHELEAEKTSQKVDDSFEDHVTKVQDVVTEHGVEEEKSTEKDSSGGHVTKAEDISTESYVTEQQLGDEKTTEEHVTKAAEIPVESHVTDHGLEEATTPRVTDSFEEHVTKAEKTPFEGGVTEQQPEEEKTTERNSFEEHVTKAEEVVTESHVTELEKTTKRDSFEEHITKIEETPGEGHVTQHAPQEEKTTEKVSSEEHVTKAEEIPIESHVTEHRPELEETTDKDSSDEHATKVEETPIESHVTEHQPEEVITTKKPEDSSEEHVTNAEASVEDHETEHALEKSTEKASSEDDVTKAEEILTEGHVTEQHPELVETTEKDFPGEYVTKTEVPIEILSTEKHSEEEEITEKISFEEHVTQHHLEEKTTEKDLSDEHVTEYYPEEENTTEKESFEEHVAEHHQGVEKTTEKDSSEEHVTKVAEIATEGYVTEHELEKISTVGHVTEQPLEEEKATEEHVTKAEETPVESHVTEHHPELEGTTEKDLPEEHATEHHPELEKITEKDSSKEQLEETTAHTVVEHATEEPTEKSPEHLTEVEHATGEPTEKSPEHLTEHIQPEIDVTEGHVSEVEEGVSESTKRPVTLDVHTGGITEATELTTKTSISFEHDTEAERIPGEGRPSETTTQVAHQDSTSSEKDKIDESITDTSERLPSVTENDVEEHKQVEESTKQATEEVSLTTESGSSAVQTTLISEGQHSPSDKVTEEAHMTEGTQTEKELFTTETVNILSTEHVPVDDHNHDIESQVSTEYVSEYTPTHITVEVEPEIEAITKVPSISVNEEKYPTDSEFAATERPEIISTEGHVHVVVLPSEEQTTAREELPEITTKIPRPDESSVISSTEKEYIDISSEKEASVTESYISPEVLHEATEKLPVEENENLPGHDQTQQQVTEDMNDFSTEELEHLVPGEGNCLVDGLTYTNNTSVPPINHCQLSCKCISSILQCESVICLPAPSNLHNCMPVYQSPNSCCPTYSCTAPEPGEIESDSHKMEASTSGRVPSEEHVTIAISVLPAVETTPKMSTVSEGTEKSTAKSEEFTTVHVDVSQQSEESIETESYTTQASKHGSEHSGEIPVVVHIPQQEAQEPLQAVTDTIGQTSGMVTEVEENTKKEELVTELIHEDITEKQFTTASIESHETKVTEHSPPTEVVSEDHTVILSSSELPESSQVTEEGEHFTKLPLPSFEITSEVVEATHGTLTDKTQVTQVTEHPTKAPEEQTEIHIHEQVTEVKDHKVDHSIKPSGTESETTEELSHSEESEHSTKATSITEPHSTTKFSEASTGKQEIHEHATASSQSSTDPIVEEEVTGKPQKEELPTTSESQVLTGPTTPQIVSDDHKTDHTFEVLHTFSSTEGVEEITERATESHTSQSPTESITEEIHKQQSEFTVDSGITEVVTKEPLLGSTVHDEIQSTAIATEKQPSEEEYKQTTVEQITTVGSDKVTEGLITVTEHQKQEYTILTSKSDQVTEGVTEESHIIITGIKEETSHFTTEPSIVMEESTEEKVSTSKPYEGISSLHPDTVTELTEGEMQITTTSHLVTHPESEEHVTEVSTELDDTSKVSQEEATKVSPTDTEGLPETSETAVKIEDFTQQTSTAKEEVEHITVGQQSTAHPEIESSVTTMPSASVTHVLPHDDQEMVHHDSDSMVTEWEEETVTHKKHTETTDSETEHPEIEKTTHEKDGMHTVEHVETTVSGEIHKEAEATTSPTDNAKRPEMDEGSHDEDVTQVIEHEETKHPEIDEDVTKSVESTQATASHDKDIDRTTEAEYYEKEITQTVDHSEITTSSKVPDDVFSTTEVASHPDGSHQDITDEVEYIETTPLVETDSHEETTSFATVDMTESEKHPEGDTETDKGVTPTVAHVETTVSIKEQDYGEVTTTMPEDVSHKESHEIGVTEHAETTVSTKTESELQLTTSIADDLKHPEIDEEAVTQTHEQFEIITTVAGAKQPGVDEEEVTSSVEHVETTVTAKAHEEAEATTSIPHSEIHKQDEHDKTTASIKVEVTTSIAEVTKHPETDVESQEKDVTQIVGQEETTHVTESEEQPASVTQAVEHVETTKVTDIGSPKHPQTDVGAHESVTQGVENIETTASAEVHDKAESEKQPEISSTHGVEYEHTSTHPIEHITESVSTEIHPPHTSEPSIDTSSSTSGQLSTESVEAETGEKEVVENVTTEKLYTSGPSTSSVVTVASIEGELSTSQEIENKTSQASSTSGYSPVTTETITEASTSTPDFVEPDYHEYEDEDQSAFGPGTCRYGGKFYVSAQQIPRDDPCDFCFCFRSDIICLQQSCPPPIPRCHEEPIRGFCCPRYECPVSMATTVNITTPTTTTTTTLPPHFFSHAYKGRATRQGCQIQGQAYQVGEEIPSASGPCLHCKCGGNGQMKCDPKACSPEPMLRKMIAEVASRRRR